MIGLVQFPDFNLIENLWYIIKIQVNSYYHRIYLVEKMKVAISKKLENLIEEDYKKYIKSIS